MTRQLAGWLLVALLVVVPSVASYITLSPIDELQHIDSMIKGGQLDVVRAGEKVSEPALREQSCRGIDSPGFVSPPCDAVALSPLDFQEAGDNTAAIHPPTYYVVTGLLSRAAVKVGLVGSPVTAARLIGALWLAAGLVLTAGMARALGASAAASAAAAALLAGTPVVILSSTTVTPDATSLLSGAAISLATVLYLRGRLPVGVLLPAAAVATVFKATGILVVGACCLAVILHHRSKAPETERHPASWFTPTAMLIIGGAAPVLIWSTIVQAIKLDVPAGTMSRFNVDTITWDQLVANVVALLPPTNDAYLQPELDGPSITLFVALLGYILVGGLVAVCLRGSGSRLVDSVGGALLAAMLLGGPLLVVLTFLVAGSYVEIPARYGLVLLPGAAAVIAALATKRGPAVAGLAGFGLLQLLVYWAAING